MTAAVAAKENVVGQKSNTAGMMDYLGVNAEMATTLKSVQPLAEKHLSQCMDEAYGRAASVPDIAHLFSTPERLATVKSNNMKRWTYMLGGDFDPIIKEMALSEGNQSGAGGVDACWHVGSYGLILGKLLSAMVKDALPKKSIFSKSSGDAERLADAIDSIVRAAFFDVDLLLDLYRRRAAEERAVLLSESEDESERVGEIFGKALSAIAGKDLRYRIEEELPGKFRKMRDDFNHAAEQLATIVADIDHSAEDIRSGSHEISVATDDLSRRTEQQAASIEETAAALEEITTTVSETARRAEDAGKLVNAAKLHAEKSGTVVSNAITAMGEIEASSSAISSIIGVIDDIAFQTNLLALNAGVEAARAGDAGKGFAVVAQEVRELAQRSANAAREIKALISKSSEQVKSGVGLVGETGNALQAIAAQVQDINVNVIAIVEASREQALGLKEINQAVATMDQGTQQNAAMVEETTAASHALGEAINKIGGMLDQFRTGKRNRGAAASAVPASAHARPATAPAKPAIASKAAAYRPAVPAIKGVDANTPISRASGRPPVPARQQAALAAAFAPSSKDQDWEEF